MFIWYENVEDFWHMNSKILSRTVGLKTPKSN